MRTLLLLLFLTTGVSAAPQSVSFAWDANTETNIARYMLYGGAASGVYNRSNSIVGRTNSTFTVTNVPTGQSFWVVTAIDTGGLESDRSNEVSYTNRPAAPKFLRLSSIVQGARALPGPWETITMRADSFDFTLAYAPDFPATNEMRFFRSQLDLLPVESQ